MDSDRKLTAEEKQAHEANILAAKAQDSAEKKVKPALKKKAGFNAAAAAGEAADDHHEKKALKWDEVAITEHDKLRGTRMKIEEPNTPYTHYDSGQESDDSSGKQLQKSPVSQSKNALSWDALQNRLDSLAAVQDAFPSMDTSSNTSSTAMNTTTGNDNDGQSQSSDGATRDAEKQELKKLEFAEHRKRHYNEMELVRQYRQQHADDDDDE